MSSSFNPALGPSSFSWELHTLVKGSFTQSCLELTWGLGAKIWLGFLSFQEGKHNKTFLLFPPRLLKYWQNLQTFNPFKSLPQYTTTNVIIILSIVKGDPSVFIELIFDNCEICKLFKIIFVVCFKYMQYKHKVGELDKPVTICCTFLLYGT